MADRMAALPPAFFTVGGSSFTQFLATQSPEVLPSFKVGTQGSFDAPHGTTIIAMTFAGGVLMAGDRRATLGNLIAQRTNTSNFTNGTIMLGYMDLFSSIASPAADAFVLFDNVRVETFPAAT